MAFLFLDFNTTFQAKIGGLRLSWGRTNFFFFFGGETLIERENLVMLWTDGGRVPP